ncbi:MAG: HIT domain-containing protein [Acidobacteriaceae bacterium]|nr:HIT domain-containing protein [Acidobacteriaceae bacterium]MBV9501513.1 HIT domain-containing protein [Acidobacteriaceae bacterium]
MDHLWAPWRSTYFKEKHIERCLFCQAARTGDDKAMLVVYRAEHNFVMLNRYPYASGHLMIAPYQHASRLSQIDPATAEEMIHLAQRAEQSLQNAYHPGGLNIGMNLGAAAGAGIEQHIHLHVLPRWIGDANFMTAVGNTRVLPEDLDVTFDKVKQAFAQ